MPNGMHEKDWNVEVDQDYGEKVPKDRTYM